ncbi:MAG: patatin-like phospholipase family protein [Oligoflexus sp.]
MLEFVLTVGGLRGITLVGTLMALRERKLVPNVVTGVSVGAFAAYQAYSGLSPKQVENWYQISRNHFRSRSGISRFLPPYDTGGMEVLKLCEPFMVDNDVFRQQGLDKFLVGYTSLPSFQFVIEDILQKQDKMLAFHPIIKSSLIPFVTHFSPHCQGAIDGGVRKMFFCSKEETRERWLFSFENMQALTKEKSGQKVTRKIILKTPISSLTAATNRQLKAGLEAGYEQGMKLDIG